MNSVRVGWGWRGRGGSREDLPRLQSFPGLGDAYLHPFHRISKRTGLVDEVCMLHILGESLEEAQRLVKYNWHGDLGEFLVNRKMETVMSKIHSKPTRCRLDITCSWKESHRNQQPRNLISISSVS